MKYRGEQQITSTGKPCLNWANITRDYDVSVYPDAETGKDALSQSAAFVANIKTQWRTTI